MRGRAFLERDLAERCQAWCEAHPSCNLALGRRAVGSVAPDRRT